VRSAGGQHDVTSEVSLPLQGDPGVTMPQRTLLKHATSERIGDARPLFACVPINEGLGATWLRASGELDRASAPRLADALRAARRKQHLVVLDLRELTLIDSAGVCAIVDATFAARREGPRLLLVPAAPLVHRIFALMGSSDDIDVLNLGPDEQPIELFAHRSRRRFIAR
jgi:anti-anti-sigma factor